MKRHRLWRFDQDVSHIDKQTEKEMGRETRAAIRPCLELR